MSNFIKRCCSIPTILLIILVIVFHTELFVLGVRLYAAVVESPQAERMLGDYYQNASRQNLDYANIFYQRAFTKNKANLSKENVSDKEKAMIDLKMGRFYECGKGMPADLAQAKKWYEDASKAAKAASDDKLKSESDEALNRVTQAMQSKTPLTCPYKSDIELLMNTIKGENK